MNKATPISYRDVYYPNIFSCYYLSNTFTTRLFYNSEGFDTNKYNQLVPNTFGLCVRFGAWDLIRTVLFYGVILVMAKIHPQQL